MECYVCKRDLESLNEYRRCDDCELVEMAVGNPGYRKDVLARLTQLRDDSEALRQLAGLGRAIRFSGVFGEWRVFDSECDDLGSGPTALEAVRAAQARLEGSDGTLR